MRLAYSPLLEPLTGEQRKAAEDLCRPRSYRPNEVIYHADDPADVLHFVCEGLVAVRRYGPDGLAATLDYRGPGSLLGLLALVSNHRRSATAHATRPTQTLVMSSADFTALRREYPGVDAALVQMLASRVESLGDHLHEALRCPAEQRVARRLVAALAQIGTEIGAVPITQEDLASLAGTSRATVNKTLRSLEREGVLSLERSLVQVKDVGRLKARARGPYG